MESGWVVKRVEDHEHQYLAPDGAWGTIARAMFFPDNESAADAAERAESEYVEIAYTQRPPLSA